MSLFPDDRPEQAARLAPKLRDLASQGVFIGTSSWKYDGWLGSIYSPARYVTRGKHSKAKFEADCLTEYAETFPTVCGDFAFYQFPTPEYWAKLFDATPREFVFGLKVPEDVTVAKWPGHARYGARAAQDNEHFLNPAIFASFFAKRLESYHKQVGPLIFEFGTFNKQTFPTPADFLARLDAFLGALLEGFRYAVEIRNPEHLWPDYLGVLARHNVAHTFNAWTRMPALDEQAQLDDAELSDRLEREIQRSGRLAEAVTNLSKRLGEVRKTLPKRCGMGGTSNGISGRRRKRR